MKISAITKAAPAIAEASAALDISRDNLASVDPGGLAAPLRGPIGTLKDKVGSLAAVSHNADLAAQLLPDMLGANGTRRYFLMNQNNAETRPTGGIVGSYAVITAKKGKLSIGTQGSIQDMLPFETPVKKLTSDERDVFPSTLATDIRDVTITPDFPRSGTIARAMVKENFGIKVDGVVSVDPVALGYLLGGTGPVELNKDVVLDQNNVVGTLLNLVYANIKDPDLQDDFFALANRRIFNTFKKGEGDASAVLSAIVRGVDENRIMFWASRKAEQKQLAPTPLSGAFVTDDGKTPHVGRLPERRGLHQDGVLPRLRHLGGRRSTASTADGRSSPPPPT